MRDEQLSSWTRIARVLVAGFAVGLLAALIKGDGGGEGIPELRNVLGNLSTPWLLVAFVAGTTASRLRWGALYGAAATAAALSGFYLLSTLVQDLGDHGFAGDFGLMLSANRGYLEAGIITGPLFGSLGAWWHQSRMLHASIVAGALLMAEPLVLILLSAFGPDHVFPSSSALPAVIRLLPGWGLSTDSGTIRIAVYTGEFILGLGVVLLAVVRSPRFARGPGRAGDNVVCLADALVAAPTVAGNPVQEGVFGVPLGNPRQLHHAESARSARTPSPAKSTRSDDR